MLGYRTRGMSNPQGKAKVYFCCHSDDFDKFFESISDEIIEKQNCSIWYPKNRNIERNEEFLENLGQMQLFVMPVTTALLFTENPALDIEFKFAIENNIPVLPLMQESGLEERFNQKCGNLQFLDKNNQDSTALSYDEKLEKYLSSVLIGDELAKKIRAAFDAYVFLSYRKKDRKYAQELMRLIHRNDFCRDVAIWYDEFLIPGEDFNDSIKRALEDSDLYILAVTPNLVNEPNYIVTTEYPMARQKEKQILPVELMAVSQEKLKEKFEKIPTCVDGYDQEKLAAALRENIKKIATKEDSPEHIFFIGLAYLGGVDVEVDFKKAVSLITCAGENGLKEAMDKLIDMYRNGIGVSRDYLTAIQWQEKKIEKLEKDYKRYKNKEILDQLFWALITCGDFYKEIGRLNSAKERYMYALKYIDWKWFGIKKTHKEYEKGICYNKIGDVLAEGGNIREAQEYYEKALKIISSSKAEIGMCGTRRELSVSYSRLGNMLRAQGKLQEARAYYEKALEVNDKLADETGTVEARRDLAISYDKIGNILKLEKKLEEAQKYYERALVIKEKIVEETGTVASKRSLSVSYNKLGSILKEQGDMEGAWKYIEKDLILSEELAEETETMCAKRDLSLSYNKMGDMLKETGKKEEAQKYYGKALEQRIYLAKNMETPESKELLAVSYSKCASVDRTRRDEYLGKAAYIYKQLYEEYPDNKKYQKNYELLKGYL